MRKIDLIVIHCSATRENTDYSPEQLESDHKARGFLRAVVTFDPASLNLLSRLMGLWAPGSLGGLKRRRDDLAG